MHRGPDMHAPGSVHRSILAKRQCRFVARSRFYGNLNRVLETKALDRLRADALTGPRWKGQLQKSLQAASPGWIVFATGSIELIKLLSFRHAATVIDFVCIAIQRGNRACIH